MKTKDPPKWKLVIFHKGKFIHVLVRDSKKGLLKVKELEAKGIRAHLISRVRAYWPPADDNLYLASTGMVWCPYCRRWRWYRIPQFKRNAKLGSWDWINNSLHRQEIACCPWCGTPETDWHVMYINNRWQPLGRRRRRRKRKRR